MAVREEMRVAGHTYAFRDRPLGDALDALRDAGFELVEVWLGHLRMSCDEVAAALAARRLCAVAVSAGGFYAPGEAAATQAFALAQAIGAPVVVACVSPLVLGEVVRAVPEDVTLCIENHWDQPLDRPGAVGAALAASGSLAACLDTGHAILAGVAPERFAAALGSRLAHVHLKEARSPALPVRLLGRRARLRLLGRPAPAFPGEGALSVARLRAALAAASYTGVVTLEHEGADAGRALATLLSAWRAAGAGSQKAV